MAIEQEREIKIQIEKEGEAEGNHLSDSHKFPPKATFAILSFTPFGGDNYVKYFE